MTKRANRVLEFFEKRISISMLLALQIFIMKTHRSKVLIAGFSVLLVAGHIIGVHKGFCPLAAIKNCEIFAK